MKLCKPKAHDFYPVTLKIDVTLVCRKCGAYKTVPGTPVLDDGTEDKHCACKDGLGHPQRYCCTKVRP